MAWERRFRTYVIFLFLIFLWAVNNFWHNCTYINLSWRRPSFSHWWWDARPPYDMRQLNDSSDPTTLVDRDDFRFLINNQRCDNDSDLFMVVFVHSAPDHFDKRLSIRETWGRENNLAPVEEMRLVFMLGETASAEVQQAIEAENALHRDIVQGNFIDSYRNLTYKHVMGLKWVTYHCRQARYVFKADDDIFVDIMQMAQYIKGAFGLTAPRRLMFCFVYRAPTVKRSHRSKWYVSFREYKEKFYPSYCAGWGILLSPDVVFDLYLQSSEVPYFWVDDVHVSGTLAKRVGLTHVEFNDRIDHSEPAVKKWLEVDGAYPLLFGYPDAEPEVIYKMWNKTMRYYAELQAR